MLAARASGVRVLVQSGWSKLHVSDEPLCFEVGPCPHDWLLPRVAAVVHHGGAGTTAAGLKAAKPTLVCPFFGDQFFWGEMVRRSGAGCAPCPIAQLTVDILSASFRELMSAPLREQAAALAAQMAKEDGVGSALTHFLASLPRHDLLCDASLLLNPPEHKLALYRLRRRHAQLALQFVFGVATGLGIVAGSQCTDKVRVKG